MMTSWRCLVTGTSHLVRVNSQLTSNYTFYSVSWATEKTSEIDHHTHTQKSLFLSPLIEFEMGHFETGHTHTHTHTHSENNSNMGVEGILRQGFFPVDFSSQ